MVTVPTTYRRESPGPPNEPDLFQNPFVRSIRPGGTLLCGRHDAGPGAEPRIVDDGIVSREKTQSRSILFQARVSRAEGSPLPKIQHDFDWETDDFDFLAHDDAWSERSSHRSKVKNDDSPVRRERNRLTRPPRSEADQAFKCGHCKQFIGAPPSGGRQRNHCPNCLYSRHVDDTAPGDRKSDCHALMKPIGILVRRNGEESIIHRCLGCGKEDPNRIAADDNPVLLAELPLVTSYGAGPGAMQDGTGDGEFM